MDPLSPLSMMLTGCFFWQQDGQLHSLTIQKLCLLAAFPLARSDGLAVPYPCCYRSRG